MKNDRTGCIGSKDYKYSKRIKRKQRGTSLGSSSSQCSSFIENSDKDADVPEKADKFGDNHDDYDEFVPPLPKRRTTSTHDPLPMHKNILSDDVCLTADKYKLSHRGLVELTGAVLKAQGSNLDTVSLSVMGSTRNRNKTRKNASTKIMSSQLSKLHLSGNVYALHWDGKLLKGLTHTLTPEERLAVLLVGSGEEILLGIYPVEKV